MRIIALEEHFVTPLYSEHISPTRRNNPATIPAALIAKTTPKI